MKNFEDWMSEYALSHKNPTNVLLHKICVPLILFSVIGFLWSLPGHESFNCAIIFIATCMLFYIRLNFKIAIGMLIQMSLMALICRYLESTQKLPQICLVIFILSWIGQFYGHKIEGKKPSFFKDLTFLLIGPLWVMRFLYQKIGIKNA